MKDKVMVAFQLSKELYDKLKSAANEKEMSLSSFIRIILLDYFRE